MKNRWDWRHQGDIARDKIENDNCITYFKDESLTQQQFMEDADLNVIARRYGLDKTQLPTAPLDPRFYADVSNVPDLRTLMDIAHDAREKFAELPPKVRARFNNEPAQLWEFVNDPDNADEAVKLGLLARAPNPEPQAPPEAAPKDT